MPNPYKNKPNSFKFELSDIRPSFSLVRFVFISLFLHQFDKKYIEWLLKISCLIYLFLPMFKNIEYLSSFQSIVSSNVFISNYFFAIIGEKNYYQLTTLYLIAPLIALYFKEHGSINDDFISNYRQNNLDSESLLDLNKDTYDKENLNCRMSKIFFNERTLKKYYLVERYLYWAKLIGEKRRFSSDNSRIKILFIVSLIIVGMPFSLATPETLYYFMSLNIFIFIMIIILSQIFYSTRNIIKLGLLNSATHAAYYYYEKEQNSDNPFEF